ncbi:hypothetical protein LXL04_007755 [Taraxacum kok-saghyz]
MLGSLPILPLPAPPTDGNLGPLPPSQVQDQHMQEPENDRNNNSNSNSAPASIATHTRAIGIIHPPPDIRTIVDKTASFVAKNGPELWTVVPSGGDVFETRYAFNGYKVDLSAHTCTCNLWMISGIPFYTDNILPVNGSNMWPRTEFIKPLPPLVRRMPGRPKVKRRKHATEAEDAKYPTQRVKQSRTVRCRNCQNLGHNMNSCKNNTTSRAQEPKRKNGRPRKDGSGQPSIDLFPPRPTIKPRTEGGEGGEGTSHVPQGTEPVKTPMKRFKMVAKRGGQGKSVHRSPMPTKNQVPTQDSQIGDDFFEELLQQPPYIPYTAFEGNYNDHNVHTYMEEVEKYKARMRKTQKRFRFDENENLGGVGNEAEKTGLNDVAVEYENENETEVELENEVNVQVDNLHELLDEVENDIMSTDQIVRNMIECGYQQHEIDETLQKLNEENCINENNENKEREEVLEQEGKKEREEVLEQEGKKCNRPNVRTRKPSERINRIKLRKIVPDADGGGSSKEQAWTCDK